MKNKPPDKRTLKTYWNKCGKHQTDYDRLYCNLVPSQGRARTMHGNLLRCMSNLYYDLYNNGLCNADTPKIQGCALFLLELEDEIKAKLGKNKDDLYSAINTIKRHGSQFQDEPLLNDTVFQTRMERVLDAVVCVVSDIQKEIDVEMMSPRTVGGYRPLN